MDGADPPAWVALEARAKINLGLEVGRKRPDGYHEIRTLMQSIRLADEIEIAIDPGGRLKLRCPDSDLPEDDRNLALRAARLLRERTGARTGARIVLRKRIPVGAGLGGGSSDAAAVLAGLSRLWRLRLSAADLESIAAELGADVPFFIRGGTQLATGMGERLARLPALPRLRALVIYPNLLIPTASIYRDRRIGLTLHGPLSNLRPCDLTTRSGVMSCLVRLRNDLEPVVARRHPRVARILRRVRALQPDLVRVSGSGSSIFVLGEDRAAFRKILADALVQTCRVISTQFAGRGWVFVVPRGAGVDI